MKTVLNVKTDKEVKERAQALAKHMGIPLSIVVNAYLKEFVATGEVAKRFAKHIAEAKQGKNISPAFTNVEDAIAWLKA
jgi:antitoxin component of RelBE/YafQ-DinJ toxin-antitoxin module